MVEIAVRDQAQEHRQKARDARDDQFSIRRGRLVVSRRRSLRARHDQITQKGAAW